MTRLLRLAAIACAGCLLLAKPAFTAPVELDAPAVDSPTELVSSATIHIDVTAGNSGAPNGFTVEWMTLAQFDAIGDVWPEDPNDPLIQRAIYVGFPSLNTVEGTMTFMLGPNAVANVELGDIFDETGILAGNRDELAEGTEYVVRVQANGDDGMMLTAGAGLMPPSNYSSTHHCHTGHHEQGRDCVRSQGYWKNHPSAWPVSTLKLGNIIYTKTQLLAIFNRSASGNGLVSLAHQLIAAKLNILSGAVPPSNVSGAITTADAMIGNKIVPPVGNGILTAATTSHLTDDLEEFNNEEMHNDILCQGTTPATYRTWAQVKSLYR
jgi:hypothetical protein